jgi:hypothetical protein
MGRNRTMSICLSDIPKERILKHQNGKLYLNLATYDLDKPDQYDNDFSVSIPLTKEEIQRKKNGETVMRTFLGNGRIWEDKSNTAPATVEDLEDLPY